MDALLHAPLKPGPKLLYTTLVSSAMQEPQPTLSQAELAALCHASARSIRRWTRVLQHVGWVRVHETLGCTHRYELVGPVPRRQHEQPGDSPLRHEAARQAASQPWDSSLVMRRETHAPGSRHSGGDRLPPDPEPVLWRSVTLPRSYIEKLEWQGNGDLSEGIRVLVEVARTPEGELWFDAIRQFEPRD